MSDTQSPENANAATWTPAADMRIVLCTIPPKQSESIATTLVEERLAACVNVIPGLRSVYRWKDAVSNDPESLLLIKTTVERLDALRARVLDLHAYDVPELVAIAPKQASTRYLTWLLESTATEELEDTSDDSA